jgi:Na+/H+-dicarboxylate symporter
MAGPGRIRIINKEAQAAGNISGADRILSGMPTACILSGNAAVTACSTSKR